MLAIVYVHVHIRDSKPYECFYSFKYNIRVQKLLASIGMHEIHVNMHTCICTCITYTCTRTFIACYVYYMYDCTCYIAHFICTCTSTCHICTSTSMHIFCCACLVQEVLSLPGLKGKGDCSPTSYRITCQACQVIKVYHTCTHTCIRTNFTCTCRRTSVCLQRTGRPVTTQ